MSGIDAPMLGGDEISAMGLRLTGRTHFAQGYWSISFRFCQIICHMKCKRALFFVSVLANLMYICMCVYVCNRDQWCTLLSAFNLSVTKSGQSNDGCCTGVVSFLVQTSRLGSLPCFFLHNFLGTFEEEKEEKTVVQRASFSSEVFWFFWLQTFYPWFSFLQSYCAAFYCWRGKIPCNASPQQKSSLIMIGKKSHSIVIELPMIFHCQATYGDSCSPSAQAGLLLCTMLSYG